MILAMLGVAACSSPPAPVVDRSGSTERPALEKDGSYRVRSGDSLYTIAFRYGLDHRELARWNNIRAPFVIYPDQVLRMTAPANAPRQKPVTTAPARTSTARTTAGSATQTSKNVSKPAPAPAKQVPVKPPAQKPASQPNTRPVSSASTASGADPKSWKWPVQGRILRGFVSNDPARNGLDIAGREGQPVVASASGTVVYSGNGLIGFGELIIIKHSDRMLSAYAHNRVRLVGEGEQVNAGQKIAEVGRNDRNEALLHFEIRVDGRPVDPRSYLP